VDLKPSLSNILETVKGEIKGKKVGGVFVGWKKNNLVE